MSIGLERLLSPGLIDIIFPFFALFFVIILPSIFAFFVIYKILFSNSYK